MRGFPGEATGRVATGSRRTTLGSCLWREEKGRRERERIEKRGCVERKGKRHRTSEKTKETLTKPSWVKRRRRRGDGKEAAVSLLINENKVLWERDHGGKLRCVKLPQLPLRWIMYGPYISRWEWAGPRTASEIFSQCKNHDTLVQDVRSTEYGVRRQYSCSWVDQRPTSPAPSFPFFFSYSVLSYSGC